MTDEHHQNKEHSQHKEHQSHHKEHTAKQKPDMLIWLAILFIVVLGVGTYFIFNVTPETAGTTEQAEISLTILGADCPDCYDITPAIQILQLDYTIKEINNITLENSNQLIEKYGITRLPAIIFEGDIDSVDLPNLDRKDNVLIFTQTPAPYYDVAMKKTIGYVEVTRLTEASCIECFNISIIEDQMTEAGIIVKARKTVEATSEEGQQLISKYNIKAIPTLLFNEELLAYEQIQQVWADFGTQEEDGTLVLRTLNPPYKLIETGQVEGVVSMTYLTDKTCENCFEPNVFYTLLKESFNLHVLGEQIIDVSSQEGKELIAKYQITKVPIVILSQDAAVYPSLPDAWPQIGTQEEDGTFIFRELDQLEGYLSSLGKELVYKNITIE